MEVGPTLTPWHGAFPTLSHDELAILCKGISCASSGSKTEGTIQEPAIPALPLYNMAATGPHCGCTGTQRFLRTLAAGSGHTQSGSSGAGEQNGSVKSKVV